MENFEISYGHVDWESLERYYGYHSGDGVPAVHNSSQRNHENFVRRAAKYFLDDFGRFLYAGKNKRDKRLVLRKRDFPEVFRRAHIESNRVHRCARETQNRISQEFYLLGLTDLVKENIKNCYVCAAKNKNSTLPKVFNPTTVNRRKEICEKVGLRFQSTASVALKFNPGVAVVGRYAVREIKDREGNCLFRALAVAVGSYTTKHAILRHRICDFIESLKGDQAYFFEKMSITAGPLAGYVHRSRMRVNGTWGTEREILAAAVIFGVDIVVHKHFLRSATRGQRSFYRNIANGEWAIYNHDVVGLNSSYSAIWISNEWPSLAYRHFAPIEYMGRKTVPKKTSKRKKNITNGCSF